MPDGDSPVRIAEYERGTALANWNRHARSCGSCRCYPTGQGRQAKCRQGRLILGRFWTADEALKQALDQLQAPLVQGRLI